MNILNGNLAKLQSIKVPNIFTDIESMGSALATSNGNFLKIKLVPFHHKDIHILIY